MKLAVLTCAVFESMQTAQQRLWIFLASCKKYGVENPYLYGIGKHFPGYRMMKLEYQLDYLHDMQRHPASRAEGYTHVLYTDAWDAFFTAPLNEIVRKYEAMGSPRILAAAHTGFADTSAPEGFGDASVARRYPHVGGYIAEIPAIIDAFEHMLKLPVQTGDDSFSWRDAWLEGWFRPVLDSNCEIFQVTDQYCGDEKGHLLNYNTHTEPCILHLCGGYTDQITGKDDRMVPWAQRLGVIE